MNKIEKCDGCSRVHYASYINFSWASVDFADIEHIIRAFIMLNLIVRSIRMVEETSEIVQSVCILLHATTVLLL